MLRIIINCEIMLNLHVWLLCSVLLERVCFVVAVEGWSGICCLYSKVWTRKRVQAGKYIKPRNSKVISVRLGRVRSSSGADKGRISIKKCVHLWRVVTKGIDPRLALAAFIAKIIDTRGTFLHQSLHRRVPPASATLLTRPHNLASLWCHDKFSFANLNFN